jgi:DNA-binding GntR family transcriptional regulator
MTAARRTTPTALGATRTAAVTGELRRLILAGELRPGTRLRQVELAERFKVSTTPVREAFSALAKEGLVRHDAQRGVVVFTPTLDDVHENYEIRIALETLATELAAHAIDDATLARLDDVVVRMRRVRRSHDYQRLNREFHRTVYAAAERPRLFELIESLRDAFEAYIHLDAVVRPDPGYNDAAHAEHEAIAEALRAREPRRARTLMEQHLEHNASHVAATLAMADGGGAG